MFLVKYSVSILIVSYFQMAICTGKSQKFLTVKWTYLCGSNSFCKKEIYNNTAEEQISLETCFMTCGIPPILPSPKKIIQRNQKSNNIDIDGIELKTKCGENISNLLSKSFKIFKKNIKRKNMQSSNDINTLKVIIDLYVDSNNSVLDLKTDEGYELYVEETFNEIFCTVLAKTYFGARHGLETISQLIWWDTVDSTYKILSDVFIEDYPAFAYRGLMIDTARNYFPLSDILRVVDGMAASKLNVLHLHLTDSSSFPAVLPKVSQLAMYGAYDENKVYTTNDLQKLQKYAKIRGIRLLLEVDVPSHVRAGWEFLNDSIICYKDEISDCVLNRTNGNVFNILENIYSDLLSLNGQSEIFHVGGDEIDMNLWRKDKSNIDDRDIWVNFTNNMLAKLKYANGNKYPDNIVIWSSPQIQFLPYIDFKENMVVQHWFGSPLQVLSNGFKIIYSTVDNWYLDCGHGHWKSNKTISVCDPFKSWQTVYNHYPWDTYGNRDLTLGGEICLWTELVSVDELETRIWPRSAAFAEVLWSDSKQADIGYRLSVHRDRLTSRGIKSSGMWPMRCSQYRGYC